MKYRKKPMVIDAYQTLLEEKIETPEGVMVASPGDWIITGVWGERYPCKDGIFQETYDAVLEDSDPDWLTAPKDSK